MSKIKNSLLAGVAALGFATSAVAADLPVKAPVYATNPQVIGSWTGGYIGAQIGYGWDWSGMDLTAGTTTINGLGNAPQGFTGGGRLGYDAQVGNIVFGISSEINGANFTNSGGISSGAAAITTGATTNWWGDLNGRIGTSMFGDHVMPYITAGLAYGGTKASFTMPGAAGAISNTSVGWDAGVGIETRFTRNWSMFIEGRFIDLGTTSVPIFAPGLAAPVLTSSQKFQFGVVEGGLNYRF